MTYTEENNRNICNAISHLRSALAYTRFAGQSPELDAAYELLRRAEAELGRANVEAADRLARAGNPGEFA